MKVSNPAVLTGFSKQTSSRLLFVDFDIALGMSTVALSTNLFMLFVGLELASFLCTRFHSTRKLKLVLKRE